MATEKYLGWIDCFVLRVKIEERRTMDLANKHLAAGLSCEKPYYPIKTMAYKQLLYALSEDIQTLETTVSNACYMCTGNECTECNLCHFREELEAILDRATERKKRFIVQMFI